MDCTLSVIIPAWNLWEMTRDCLHSLAAHSTDAPVEVIVVDNGSTDATANELEPLGAALFGARFRAVRLPENQGFARGCNAGARVASSPLLFFLNNDTLMTEGWLPPLLAAAAPAGVGVVGARLLYPGNDRVQHVGVCFNPCMEVGHLYHFFPKSCPLTCQPRTLQAVTGAALLIGAELFAECGGFFEGFVNGFEDLDLCCQVRKRGKSVVLAPESVIYHLTSQTPGRFDHDAPNAQLLSERSQGLFTPDAHRIGLADGLSPALNATQSFYLALPEEHEQALTAAFTAHFQEDRCRQRLGTYPLWRGGYDLMARHLEQAGQYEDALAWRSMQLRFFPLESCALELTRCATRLRNPEMLAYAAAVLEEVRLDAGAIPQLRARAGAVVRRARERGDAVLERLYTDWIARYAPNPVR